MPALFINKGGWRGEHATEMRTIKDWNNETNNTNKLQFSVLPAGYFASGKMGLPKGFEGLGYAAAFWSSTEKNNTTARFMFSKKTTKDAFFLSGDPHHEHDEDTNSDLTV